MGGIEKKILIVFSLLILSTFFSTAQEDYGSISGKISPSGIEAEVFVKIGGFPSYLDYEVKKIAISKTINGEYNIPLPEGVYDLVIVSDGYSTKTISGVEVKRNFVSKVLEITLEPVLNGGVISGYVRPKNSSTLILVKKDSENEFAAIADSDNGFFEIRGLTPGNYWLVIPGSDLFHMLQWRDLRIVENNETQINITLTPRNLQMLKDRVFVEFLKTLPESERETLISESGSKIISKLENVNTDVYLIDIPDNKDVPGMISFFKSNDKVSNSYEYVISSTSGQSIQQPPIVNNSVLEFLPMENKEVVNETQNNQENPPEIKKNNFSFVLILFGGTAIVVIGFLILKPKK